MNVQIDNTNTKAVVSGHVFKDDCPDRANYDVNNIRNRVKTDALIKSGHRANDADKHDVNDDLDIYLDILFLHFNQLLTYHLNDHIHVEQLSPYHL